MAKTDYVTIHVETVAAWRQWLEKNHKRAPGAWVIHWKRHTGNPAMSHREAMDEALCFGWIDTIVKRLDDDRFVRGFARRGPNARWSSATLGYADRLLADGRMAQAGIDAYQRGRSKRPVDYGRPKNPPIPAELRLALSRDRKAKAGFAALSPSACRVYLHWIGAAKRPETRAARVAEVVKRAAAGKAWGK
jgi:uncharacterized protein YdeI (YjbR/CyaY-like superfamily)